MSIFGDLVDTLDMGAAAGVTVTPDPNLMAADPAAMESTSAAYGSAARRMYQLFQTASTAGAVLLGSWHGKAATNFEGSAETTNENAQTAADALIGVSGALKVLSTRIADAQHQARQAMLLAEQTRSAAAGLARSAAAGAQARVDALPAHSSVLQAVSAAQPTGAEVAQAEGLASDASRAVTLMDAANEEARAAWKQAQSAFDAVTAQSPSVQNSLMTARINAFNQQMDNAAVLFAGSMVAGSLDGDLGGDDGDDDDDGGVDLDDPEIAKLIEEDGLADGEKETVDGLPLDETIAVDGNSNIVVEDQEAEQSALGDPVGGTEIANPSAYIQPGEYPYLGPKLPDDVGATPGKMPSFEAGYLDGPVPPGWTEPPPEDLANFTGAVHPTAATDGITYYRVVGEGNSPAGSWWTTTPPTSADRPGLAIKGSWNSMTGIVSFTPAAGESIPGWEGAAAPQGVTLANGRPGYLPGGADQIYVPSGAFNNNNGTFRIQPMPGAS